LEDATKNNPLLKMDFTAQTTKPHGGLLPVNQNLLTSLLSLDCLLV